MISSVTTFLNGLPKVISITGSEAAASYTTKVFCENFGLSPPPMSATMFVLETFDAFTIDPTSNRPISVKGSKYTVGSQFLSIPFYGVPNDKDHKIIF